MPTDPKVREARRASIAEKGRARFSAAPIFVSVRLHRQDARYLGGVLSGLLARCDLQHVEQAQRILDAVASACVRGRR
jgi:hypothetical protein